MRSYRCQERLVTVRPIGGGTGDAWVHYSVRSESGGGGVYWRQIETAERRIARKVRGAKGNEHLPSSLPPEMRSKDGAAP